MTEIRQVILAICGEIVPYLTERKGEVVFFNHRHVLILDFN